MKTIMVFVLLSTFIAAQANAQTPPATSDNAYWARYEFFGARTIESHGASPSTKLQLDLGAHVFLLDKGSGQIQLCQGTFTYATYTGALISAGARCSPFPYVSQPDAPVSGAFAFAADIGRQLSPGPIDSVLLLYWLVDSGTGAVQLCASNSSAADNRFRVKCVPGKVVPPL